MIKVAFISRATLYSSPGGDTKQIDLTARSLRALGVQVDVHLANAKIDYNCYDLLHFFNIIRPADILKHIDKALKPFVVSTIFVDYGEYEKKTRGGMMRLLKKIFSEDGVEYIKVAARWIKNGDRPVSEKYLWLGHRRSVMYVARKAAMLLPNSESEYRRFVSKYNITAKYMVVPNGINEQIAACIFPVSKEYTDAIMCAARIEGGKNQLNLIRALNNTDYKVFIYGKPSPNNVPYYKQCQREATSNIHFAGWLPEEALYEKFHSARVHVLPSYFETTGLSSLEAAVMGCNIVITDRGDTRDYFGNHAWYCDPDDPASIKAAVDAAFNAPYDESFRQYILTHYTWQRAAEETLKAYRQVLHKD